MKLLTIFTKHTLIKKTNSLSVRLLVSLSFSWQRNQKIFNVGLDLRDGETESVIYQIKEIMT